VQQVLTHSFSNMKVFMVQHTHSSAGSANVSVTALVPVTDFFHWQGV